MCSRVGKGMGAVWERAGGGSSSVETKQLPAACPAQERAKAALRTARYLGLPINNCFGGVVKQVVYALNLCGAPVPLMQLQGMAQIVHRLMYLCRSVMAPQRASTYINAHVHTIKETPNKSPSMLKYSLTTCPECVMSQMSFSDFEYAGKRKQTRRERFLAEMDQVVPWSGLLALIEPYYPKAGGGRKPYPLETMLRIHLLQNWFSLSDPAMEEALYEITPMRQFAHLTLSAPIPEDTTIMNFRHLLENHKLAPAILAVINGYLQEKGLSLRQGTIVDATIIHAPSSTKNEDGKRDPEMHQTKKGNQYFFGMKAHIGADVELGLVHHVHGTAANVADVTQVAELLHGEENAVYADAGYTGVEKREEHENREVVWQIAARRSTYSKLSKRSVLYKAKRKIEYLKAQTRAKVEHPFRVIKRQFGYVKVRFRGLMKNTAQLTTLFALSNLWMARKKLMGMG